MSIPIYKKTIFDTMENRQTEIANKICNEDKLEIQKLMDLFISNKDARGSWQIPRKQGMQMLPYFQKYVDNGARSNIFGCGGCATKMIDYMFSIYKIWQNQIK